MQPDLIWNLTNLVFIERFTGSLLLFQLCDAHQALLAIPQAPLHNKKDFIAAFFAWIVISHLCCCEATGWRKQTVLLQDPGLMKGSVRKVMTEHFWVCAMLHSCFRPVLHHVYPLL